MTVLGEPSVEKILVSGPVQNMQVVSRTVGVDLTRYPSHSNTQSVSVAGKKEEEEEMSRDKTAGENIKNISSEKQKKKTHTEQNG